MILNYLDGTIQTTNTYTILNNLDTSIIPSVTSNINIGNTDKTIKELFVNDILLDEGDIIKRSRYSVDISTSNITSNIINTEENYIVFNLNQDDLDTNGNGTTTYTLDFTNITIGKVLINDFLGREYNIVLTSPITIDVGTTYSKIITNNNTYNTVGGLSNIESDITGSNIIYTSPIVIIRYYNWGYNTESYFNRNYYSLWNRPYIPTKEIDFYNQEYINDYSIKRVFKNIYYENFYDAKMPTDTIDTLTENLNNELILNNLDANDYFQVISLRYTRDNINSSITDSTTIETGPHFISEDDTQYSTNKYIAFRGKDGAKYRFFITQDISNLIKMTDSITISYIVGSGSVNNGIEDYGNGGDKPINGALRIQILNSNNNIIFNEIIWNSSSGYNANWQLYTISIDNTTRQNGIKLKIVHIYNPSTNENWNQTFGIRYIGLNLLNEYKNYINLENIPTSYPTSNNILWTDNYGNLKIDNYQYSQNYNTLENIPFDITSNYIYTNLNKNIGIGTTTPQETLQVNGNVFINSNLTIGSNIYFSGDLYKNGNLYTSYTDSDTSNYLLHNLNTSIIPKDTLTYDLGSVENRFRDLYIGTNSIWFGDSHKMSVSGDKIKMKKVKIDAVPQGLVTKLSTSMSEDDIKQDIIATMGQSNGGNSGGGDSEVFGCGRNIYRQLGLGDQSNRNLLNKIDYFTSNIIIDDISGSDHTLFLDQDGKVYSCGGNYNGQLGLGDFTSRSIPALIQYDNTNNNMPFITKISVGDAHSLILDNSGHVYSFGENDTYGQLGLGNFVNKNRPTSITYFNSIYIKDISAGRYHSLFLDNNGQAYGCGMNELGQLGLGYDSQYLHSPSLIQYKNDGTSMPEITKIKCGSEISLFLDNLGNVYSCGINVQGQLGIGNTTNKNRPTEIQNYQDQTGTSLSKPKIIDMSVGEYHILLLDEDGKVYSCGTNLGGILGFSADNFSTTINLWGNNFKLINKPTLITNFIDGQQTTITPTPKINKISCGHQHSLFLDENSKSYSCGGDYQGQLCHGFHENYFRPYNYDIYTTYYTNIPTLITKIQNDDGTESNIPNNITHISASQFSTFISTENVASISLTDLSLTLKDWLDYAKTKDTTITNINDIFTDEDTNDENIDIWLSSNSNIYFNSSNYNRLGIGTTNPQETLHVEGNTIINSNLTVGSNIYFSGDLYKNGELYTSYTNTDTSNYLLNNLDTSIIPKDDLTYDLGAIDKKFGDLFIGDSSIWMGNDNKLSMSNGKVKIRKVKTGFIPTIITNHSNYDINSLFTIAGTTNINDIKPKDFYKYAKTLNGLENIKMNQLFTDNDNEYEEQNAIDSWLIKGTSNIILANYSNIGLGTDNPLEKLHIVGNTIIDGNLTIDGDITLNGNGLYNESNFYILASYSNFDYFTHNSNYNISNITITDNKIFDININDFKQGDVIKLYNLDGVYDYNYIYGVYNNYLTVYDDNNAEYTSNLVSYNYLSKQNYTILFNILNNTTTNNIVNNNYTSVNILKEDIYDFNIDINYNLDKGTDFIKLYIKNNNIIIKEYDFLPITNDNNLTTTFNINFKTSLSLNDIITFETNHKINDATLSIFNYSYKNITFDNNDKLKIKSNGEVEIRYNLRVGNANSALLSQISLHNLPTSQPAQADIVWRDSEGYLRIS